MNKAEKRLKRKLEKQLKQDEKNARLSESVVIKDQYIRSNYVPSLDKKPSSLPPDSYKNHYFSWCDSHSDIDGAWSWGEARAWTDDEHSSSISSTLNSNVNNSWKEVESKDYNGAGGFRKLLNKYQELTSLCDEAQARWLDLDYLSQFEELFRLRAGSNKRLWGVRVQHHFFLVWYERDHKICPIKN